jgi:hypothetical protein
MFAMCLVLPSRSDSSNRAVRVCSLVALYRFRDVQPYGSCARRALIARSGLDGEKGSLRPTSRSQSMDTLQMSSHGTAMTDQNESSEQIVSAGLALVTL